MQTNRHNLSLRTGRLWRRAAKLSAITLTIACFCAAWLGCTAQKKYDTLSFFFDGVPNPNSPSTNINSSSTGGSGINGGRAALAFQHKPFAEGNCAACHQPDKKIDVAHLTERCLACHKNVEKQYPVMHAPVTTGQCLWCHRPHESSEPKLLVASSQKLCRQCHDGNALSPDPPEHLDVQRSCLDCHRGHGGVTGHFLKRDVLSTTLPTHGGPP